jgi:hypothetical protein
VSRIVAESLESWLDDHCPRCGLEALMGRPWSVPQHGQDRIVITLHTHTKRSENERWLAPSAAGATRTTTTQQTPRTARRKPHDQVVAHGAAPSQAAGEPYAGPCPVRAALCTPDDRRRSCQPPKAHDDPRRWQKSGDDRVRPCSRQFLSPKFKASPEGANPDHWSTF